MPDTSIPYKRTLLLDSSGDLQFDSAGKLKMTETNIQKRSQDLYIYLKTMLGEDMFDTSYGLNLVAIKTETFNKELVIHEIKKTITQYRNRSGRPDRIKSIDSIKVSDPDEDRNVEVTINITADTGEAEIISLRT